MKYVKISDQALKDCVRYLGILLEYPNDDESEHEIIEDIIDEIEGALNE